MKANIMWDSKINGSDYLIEYVETNFMGKVTLMVNGELTKYIPTKQSGQGNWVLFNCGKKECLLKISLDKKTAEVYVNGKPLSENPVIEDIEGEEDITHSAFESVELNRKVRNGTGSFFTIIVLSVINVFLTLFNAPVSFPFSIFSANFALGMGFSFNEEFGGTIILIVATAIAFAMIAFYAVLYFFSIRSMAAIWIAFAFLIMDTLGLVAFGFLSQEIVSMLIDIGFHGWILWSVLQLGLAKKKLTQITMERIYFHENSFNSVNMEAITE